MAVGDSLLNGMRSCTINGPMAASSIPARLGGSLVDVPGFARFQPSTYPEPILIDVEAEIRKHAKISNPALALLQVVSAVGQIKREVTENARRWLSRFEADGDEQTPEVFDNLAIAGARIEDVFELTYKQVEARVGAMAPVIREEADPLKWAGTWPEADPHAAPGAYWGVGDVHIALNSRHLRNPANRPGLDGTTVLDVVAARRPRVLLLNLGPNHGLVDVAMRHGGEEGMAGLRSFAAAWPACARELAALPGVEAVVVMLMPRPSQIPCLMPPNPNDAGDNPGGNLEPAPSRPDHYFDEYVSAIDPISSGRSYNGDEVVRLDRELDEVNAEVRAATTAAFAGSGKALCCVSFADLLARHDYKHRRGPKLPGGESGRGYSNYALGRMWPDRLRGGLCGLDHVHPTTLGYSYVAEEIRRGLAELTPSREIEVTDAGDEFLRRPHWPTIAVLDALYPRRAVFFTLDAPSRALLLAQREPADRLLFRPGWLR